MSITYTIVHFACRIRILA